MNKNQLVSIAYILLIMCAALTAESYLATWDANTEPDLAGYTLYIRHADSTEWEIAEQTTETGMGFDYPGPVCVALTAHDSSGNISNFSEIVCSEVITEWPLSYYDTNGDGIITLYDGLRMYEQYGSTPADSIYDPAYDLIPDNHIGIPDGYHFRNVYPKYGSMTNE